MEMRSNLIRATVLLLFLTTACIGQKDLTVDEWKQQVVLVTPPLGQDPMSMITGIDNVGILPVGTHFEVNVDYSGTAQGVSVDAHMTISITVMRREVSRSELLTVLDVGIDAHFESQNEAVDVVIEGTEWLDEDGVPVRIEEEVAMNVGGFDVPMVFILNRTGEDMCGDRECWVFMGTQTINLPGLGESRVVGYVDKGNGVVVRAMTSIGGEEVDTGFMEPPVAIGGLTWELGSQESVKTDMGNIKCQAIYLSDDSEKVGTVWVNKDMAIPLQIVRSYKSSYLDLSVTMTLVTYQV
ncbi:MAG: hypothetical protein HXS43_13340 [Theionarchaea archaeon]|nr:hypothetical protein [Theionarchaea archaeon]